MTKKKKIILSVSGVLLVLVLYGWFFGVQTLSIIGLRFLDKTVVDAVPESLSVRNCSKPVTRLSASGISFSVPWTDCVQTNLSDGVVLWACEASNIHIIYHDVVKMTETLTQDDHNEMNSEEILATTGYEFKSNMFFTTSADVSFFTSRSNAVAVSCMLFCKIIGDNDVTTGTYSFELRDIKGFQRGSPQKDRMVDLDIFDRQNQEYQLLITCSPSFPFSQADINTIITTFSVEP